MKLLMCRPDFYGIEYQINPWMDINKQTHHVRAITQWEALYEVLLGCGAEIELIQPISGWPDMIFTANAGLFYQNKIILSHFKFAERKGEVRYFKEWFLKAGYSILWDPTENLDLPIFEGAGDALLAGDHLFAGYGFRTDRSFYESLPVFQNQKIIYCELTNPYFYHIDTCFCPLNANQAIWYPDAFSEESQKQMKNSIELFAVAENEAKNFACNAVVLGQQIVLPFGAPKLAAQLGLLGFDVYTCEMDEYIKAGGACKCLTLRMD